MATVIGTLELGNIEIGLISRKRGRLIFVPFDWQDQGHLSEVVLNESARSSPWYLKAENVAKNPVEVHLYFGSSDRPFDPASAIKLELQPGESTIPIYKSDSMQNSRDGANNFFGKFWGTASLEMQILLHKRSIKINSEKGSGRLSLKMRTSRLHQKTYEAIVDQLDSSYGSLDPFSPMLRGRRLLRDSSEWRRNIQKPIELYIKITKVIEELISTLLAILQNPSTSLQSYITSIDLSGSPFINPEQTNLVTEPLQITGTSQVYGARFIKSMVATTMIKTTHTPENLFLANCLASLLHDIQHLNNAFEEYLQELDHTRIRFESMNSNFQNEYHWSSVTEKIRDHKLANKESKRWKVSIEGYLQMFGFDFKNNKDSLSPLLSETFSYDPRYARALDLFSILGNHFVPSIDVRTEFPYNVGSFQYLYQIWSLTKIEEVLTSDLLGFEICDGKQVDLLYSRPKEDSFYLDLIHPKIPDLELKIGYEVRFEYYRRRSKHNAAYGYMDDNRKREMPPTERQKNQHRPDILLQFFHSRYNGGVLPLMMAFDPTITPCDRIDAMEAKSNYLENIRYFDRSFFDSRGIAKKALCASWAISPGSFDNRRSSATGSGLSRYEKGYLVLNPDNLLDFRSTFCEILMNCIPKDWGLWKT